MLSTLIFKLNGQEVFHEHFSGLLFDRVMPFAQSANIVYRSLEARAELDKETIARESMKELARSL